MNSFSTHDASIGGTGLHGSVLVIENDAHVCDALNDILTIVGLKVYTAHDGLEGEEMFRSLRDELDMVIMDWRLPRQNGSATLRKIRQINPKVNVMVSSGFSEEVVRSGL